MATINIAITATNPQFSTFADELGYQPQVSKSPEEIALLTEPISIQDRLKSNPQTKTAFLLDYFKGITVNELARVKAANIQRQVNEAKQAEIETLRSTIANSVSVTTA